MKSMKRRKYLISTAALSLPLAGCAGTEAEDPEESQAEGDTPTDVEEISETDTPEDKSDITEDEPEDEAENIEDESDPITFEGSGQVVTNEFDLVGGFTVADMEHTGGSSNFQVQLIDEESGDSAGLLANEIGEWSGQIGETFDTGTYVLDINADGKWSVELRQPRPTEGEKPPVEESGRTSTVLGPYELNGRVEMVGSHNGSRNFIVRTHDASATNGTFGGLIFNEIGGYEGRTTFAGQGLTWITVKADGDWEIKVE